ncbi:GerW family sporulation protein [uncultured Tyzzerella sp.]|uniref:GerW family sporulation protein n=1 Tax=uncultured Tyzzerella sp. TaxID=2321398 RepID=UPI00294241A1|nr:GerW family sporulation protein [uncultured Tyzzerella sp.]
MSNLNSSLEVLFNKMEGFISSKTVVGEPINIGDVIIVPLVDISVGVGAGSYERKEKNNENTGGGLGAKLSPSAMLVVQDGSVQLVDIKNQNSVNKIIDMVPGVVSKFNLSSFFKKDDIEEGIESTEDK